jgi:hypothetical protein
LVSATRCYENAAVNKAHGKRAAIATTRRTLFKAARAVLRRLPEKKGVQRIPDADVIAFLVDCGFERGEFE